MRQKNSEHPLAEAIVEGIREKKIDIPSSETFEAIPGFGIESVVEGKQLLIGTRRLMKKFNIDIEEVSKSMEELEREGKTAMLIAIDKEYAGIVAVADTVKDTSKAAIARLKKWV